jgi:peptidoglycan/xylan/chitin deacetylase (PgdA/CDA1 family)
MTCEDPTPIPVKLALTIDDLFQWRGIPQLDGYSYRTVSRRLTDAFANHGVRGVYAFSNTAPAAEGNTLAEVFDDWVEAGHHIGNHTHYHASLNLVTAKDYIRDIERAEALITRWLGAAPRRYFRHCYDTFGDTLEKRNEVQEWLDQADYAIAPGSIWFYDWNFAAAYLRAIKAADSDARKWLRQALVDTAVQQLRVQASAARQTFGRNPVHIWLVHGTALTADCIGAILDGFAARGVSFVSLEEAMADQMNQQQPGVTASFLNQVQKWAEAKGIVIQDCPPAILNDVENVCMLPGLGSDELFGGIMASSAQAVSDAS